MTVQGFETLDQMFEAVNTARIAADSQVQQWQSEIKKGDYFLTIFEDMFIVNYVMITTDGDIDLDLREELKHYRFCQCFSNMCPNGEIGDVHISRAIIKLCAECGKNLISYFQGNLKLNVDSIIPEFMIMCYDCGISFQQTSRKLRQ